MTYRQNAPRKSRWSGGGRRKHTDGRPRVQRAARRRSRASGSRRPGRRRARRRIASPTPTTVPDHSCPSTEPGRAYCSSTRCRSVPQTPQCETSTSALPAAVRNGDRLHFDLPVARVDRGGHRVHGRGGRLDRPQRDRFARCGDALGRGDAELVENAVHLALFGDNDSTIASTSVVDRHRWAARSSSVSMLSGSRLQVLQTGSRD